MGNSCNFISLSLSKMAIFEKKVEQFALNVAVGYSTVIQQYLMICNFHLTSLSFSVKLTLQTEIRPLLL